MHLVQNSGADRIVDLLRPHLKPGNGLRFITPFFSLFAFAELHKLLMEGTALTLSLTHKRWARQLALTPSTDSLRPCPEDSVDWSSTQNLRIESYNLDQSSIAWHKELAPAGPVEKESTCVFRDSAFANDVATTNLVAILNQHGIQNVRRL